MQAPMVPINMNMQSNADQKVRTPYPDVLTNSTTATNRQVETNYTGAIWCSGTAWRIIPGTKKVEQYQRIRRVEVSNNPCGMDRQRKFGNKWEMLIWTIEETSTCNTPTLTPGRASFFRTQDRMTRDLKTQVKMKLALGMFSQIMAFHKFGER